MSEAETLADQAIDWLRDHYDEFEFFVERDLVWTVQRRLHELVRQTKSEIRVHNDFSMIPGPRRSLSTDIALLSPDGVVLLAMEFKYEPSHRRTDVFRQKLPVVFWGSDGVAKDVERARLFVSQERALVARSYFIDEGGYFAHRSAHPGSSWISWTRECRVLISRAP
jgi:hypothetical protein